MPQYRNDRQSTEVGPDRRVYLDNNSTTALDPAVLEEMTACLKAIRGNPSSLHSFGQEARRTVDRARIRVADLIGASPEEIVFTGGGTEADNLAIFGSAAHSDTMHGHIVTTAVEHSAILAPCRRLEREGTVLGIMQVDSVGRIDPDQLPALLRRETSVISVMLANNEVGTIQPVDSIMDIARGSGILLHSDAIQAAGRIPINVRVLGVDFLSMSAHKMHGPQGVGALYIKSGVSLSPLFFGGRQERGLRPGTESVTAISGFGKACELAAERLSEDASKMLRLRDRFESSMLQMIAGTRINGSTAPRLPNTSSISFEGIDGSLLAISLDLDGLAVSTGSACSAVDDEPSHVLIAMGRTPEQARSSVRFSFGRDNTEEDVDSAVETVVRVVERIRLS